MEKAVEWHDGCSCVVAQRDRLHWRNLQDSGQAHVRKRGERVDPSRLFNSSLEGNMRCAIDIREGEKLDARAFKALIKAAVAKNGVRAKKSKAKKANKARR